MAETDFAQRCFHRGTIDSFRAEADVGFERAGEKEWILQHDAELAAQVRAASISRMSTPSSRIWPR